MSTLYLENAMLERAPAWVFIREGVIETVSREKPAAPPEADRVIDATGLHLSPSFKNGHTHAAMTLFRGWGDDLPLMEWLQTRIWPAEARMTDEHVYRGTRLALLEMIRSGSTYLNDMYWHAASVERAVEEMGLRAHVGSVFIDLGDAATERRFRASVEHDLERIGDIHPRIRRSVAPHAIYSVSPKNLEWLGEQARKHGLMLHTHLSETLDEVEGCLAAHGVRPAVLLDRLGLMADNLVVAHGVYLEPDELAILGEAGATVVTNPTANLKLATGGIFDYPGARAAGVRVVLGTDGAGSNNNLDLLEEMKIAALVQKHRAKDATVLPAREAFTLGTTNPSEAFDLGSGRVEEGEPADLVLLDLSEPWAQPGHDLISDLVYAAHGCVVHTTICDGAVLMHDHVVEVVDQDEVMREAREAARELVGSE